MNDNARTSGKGLDHYERAKVNAHEEFREDFREDFRRLMELQRQREADVNRHNREADRKLEEWLRRFKGQN